MHFWALLTSELNVVINCYYNLGRHTMLLTKTCYYRFTYQLRRHTFRRSCVVVVPSEFKNAIISTFICFTNDFPRPRQLSRPDTPIHTLIRLCQNKSFSLVSIVYSLYNLPHLPNPLYNLQVFAFLEHCSHLLSLMS